MITFDEAVSVVKEKYPEYLIRTGYEFDGSYYFSVSPDKTFVKDDLSTLTVVVDGTSSDIEIRSSGEMAYDFIMKMNDDTYKKYEEACKNIKPVDLTAEQFEELKQYLW